MSKINSFGVFLERLQAPDDARNALQRSIAPDSPSVTNVTEGILQSLRANASLDPSALLSSGHDLVEVGRATERLRSLDAIQMADENGRQVIRRGPKYEEVCALLALK